MKTVWIDAGHGGKDPGAINKSLGLYEKDLALKLALEIEKKLKEYGINVVMTRKDDVTMNYIQRYQLENKNNCNLALSIHLNSCSKENTATGAEVWVHSKAYPVTVRFAESLLQHISKVDDIKIRGVKKGYPGNPNVDFWCNRLTKSLSALLEICFINNDQDVKRFLKNYKEYASAIADACINVLK